MRIAHITDTHVRRSLPGSSARPERRSREAADLLVTALADARQRGAELVAVTGDLVDVPSYLWDRHRDSSADRELWAAVREDYRWFRRTLDESGLPWIVLPGVHDDEAILVEEFGVQPRVVEHAGVQFVSFWDHEVDGQAPQRTLAERRRFLAALKDPDPAPQVHLQYYVVTPAIAESGHPLTYLEGEQLTRGIVESGRPVLSLSGHHHPGTEPEQHGNALLAVTPGLIAAPHPYRLYDIEVGSDGTSNFSWEQVDLLPDPQPVPAVFLDRDGVINTLHTYHSGPEAMELLPGAAPAIRLLRKAGYRIVVITNQTCVGIGWVTVGNLAEVHDRMALLLAREGAYVDAIHASYDAGEAGIAEQFRRDDTRKPHPAMLLRAASELSLDLSRSYMVGDRLSDVEAGLAAGATPILVRSGLGSAAESPDHVAVVDDVAEAARLIVSRG